MIEFIKHIDSKYYVNIGENKLSILSQASIGLACVYNDAVLEEKISKPLVIGYPNKGWATLWLCLGLLVNYFEEDLEHSYSTNPLEGINSGDVIKILGVKVKWINNGRYGSIVFKGGIRQELSPTWIPFIKQFSGSSSLNKSELFHKKLKEQRNNLRPIEKILNYRRKGKNLGINTNQLLSEILIIVGRGDKGNFQRQLIDTELYEQSLHEIFGVGTNIRIELDLSKIENLYNVDTDRNINFYVHRLNQYANKLNLTELDGIIESHGNNVTTQQFCDEFDSFLATNISARIENLIHFHEEHYPGVVDDKLQNLKCIIIQEPSIAIEYSSVIESVIKKKRIPVIVVSDLLSDFSLDEVYEKNWLRFYWSISKIHSLKNIEDSENSLDNILWEKAKNYSNQSIEIHIHNQNKTEEYFSNIIQSIASLEGYEILKKKFWSIIYPCYYIFKNSINDVFEYGNYEKSISEFEDEIQRLNSDSNSILMNALLEFCEHLKTSKNVKSAHVGGENYLSQSITMNGKKYRIPVGSAKAESDSLVQVTGLPFKEKYNRSLKNLVLGELPKEVLILAWQGEAKYLEYYLFTQYRKSIYTDNVENLFSFDNLIESEKHIDQELSELIYPIEITSTSDELREDISYEYIESTHRNVRHGEYFATNKDEAQKVKIINFTNGDWYYLPIKSKMRTINYNNNQIKLQKVFSTMLSSDTQILKYKIGNEQLRKIGRTTKGINPHFKILDIWRHTLESSFSECGFLISSLEFKLNKIKEEYMISANPTKQNIRRWLNDENILSPNADNLEMILRLNNTLDSLEKILESKAAIRNFDNQIRNFIMTKMTGILTKNRIQDFDDFTHDYNGHKIEASIRTIAFIEKEVVEVPFKYCNKIMSD